MWLFLYLGTSIYTYVHPVTYTYASVRPEWTWSVARARRRWRRWTWRAAQTVGGAGRPCTGGVSQGAAWAATRRSPPPSRSTLWTGKSKEEVCQGGGMWRRRFMNEICEWDLWMGFMKEDVCEERDLWMRFMNDLWMRFIKEEVYEGDLWMGI